MVSTRTQKRFTQLRKRLKDAGFPLGYIKKALPEWWDNSLWETDSGFAQGAMILAGSFGVDLQSIHNHDAAITFNTPTKTKFKHRTDAKKEDLSVAQSINYRAGHTVAYCTKNDFTALPETAFQIREDLIERDKQDCVTFSNLLDYCWNLGISVLHINNFPTGSKKPDGMAAIINGRPVIILSKNHKYSAWLVFILAHELGHLCLNHLSDGSILVDAKIQVKDSEEAEEQEANRFARELLLGEDINYTCQTRINGKQLARIVQDIGKKTKSDPGAVALNYAHTVEFIQVGMAALGYLEPDADQTTLFNLINQKMLNNIDPELLADGPFKWLLSLTGAEA